MSMTYIYAMDYTEPYLAHHGIKGQRWGIRRYQNPDGSLTDAGKKRYSGVRGKARFYKDAIRKSDNKNDPDYAKRWAKSAKEAGIDTGYLEKKASSQVFGLSSMLSRNAEQLAYKEYGKARDIYESSTDYEKNRLKSLKKDADKIKETVDEDDWYIEVNHSDVDDCLFYYDKEIESLLRKNEYLSMDSLDETSERYLAHHGIKDQHLSVRQYVYYAIDYDSDSMAHSITALDILKKTGSNVASSVRSAVNKAGGAIEREWKKHKWIARKRGKNGKWIYDYGKGFSNENEPKKIEIIDPKEKSRKAQDMRSKRLRQQNLRDTKKAYKNFKKLDYDSDNSINVNGVRIQKDETGEAYVRSRNPYKKFSRGSNVIALSRGINEEKQKRGRGVKTHRGKQIY